MKLPTKHSATFCFMVVTALASTAFGELHVRDICRIKGQESNTLQGTGIVVGLKGTGDTDTPTLRSLANTLHFMVGDAISRSAKGGFSLDELKGTKNCAMVIVNVTVPDEGASEGTMLDCTVHATSAKSLEGGQLVVTPMLGPRPGSYKIYGLAQGPLVVDRTTPTNGKIHRACRLETDIRNPFMQDGRITLVLDRAHASFQTAQDIEDLLNNEADFVENDDRAVIARARDQVNIDVSIPRKYQEKPVEFISLVMGLRVAPPQTDARVVIRERDGVIVIDDNVEIGPVAISHKNLTIQTNGQSNWNEFVPIDTTADTSTTKLQALVNALNAVKVPTGDIIDIIKTLEREGHLYGHVIIE